jgi:hypothetical protein
MSTSRKSSQEISDMIIAQLEYYFNQTIPLLPKAFNRVIAKTLGMKYVLLYDYCGFIALQAFIKTAVNKKCKFGSRELNPLEEWGRLVDVYQDLGIRSELEIDITVLSQTGSLISGTKFVNTSTGMRYTLVGDVALNAATVTGTIRAIEVGEVGNIDVGGVVSFVNPPSTVVKDAVVSDLTTEGADMEPTEDFRYRIMVRWASRPQGGAYADYWDWAMAVSGVKNAYPYCGWLHPAIPNSRSGCVFVFVEGYGTDGIPSAALLEDVYDAIENNEAGLANRRPINAYTALGFVLPITRTSIDVSIGGLVGEDLDTLKTNIETGLTDFFLDRDPWITGLSIPPRKDIITLADVMGVVGKIASASSGYAINYSMSVDSTPITDYYALQEGEKAKLGTLTWI